MFAHSGVRQGHMASRDAVQSHRRSLLRTRSPTRKRKCCHLSQLSLSLLLYLNTSMWANTCMCIPRIHLCFCLLLAVYCRPRVNAFADIFFFLSFLFKRMGNTRQNTQSHAAISKPPPSICPMQSMQNDSRLKMYSRLKIFWTPVFIPAVG